MFIRVTGLFSCSVTAGAPLAYEPPAIEIFAVCAVAEMRWKSGATEGSVELPCGKSVPTATVYRVPFTEITAVPGFGALAPPPLEPPLPPLPEPEPALEPPEEDDVDEPSDLSLSCCAKGSLLANRLKDESWPSATTGAAVPVDDAGIAVGA